MDDDAFLGPKFHVQHGDTRQNLVEMALNAMLRLDNTSSVTDGEARLKTPHKTDDSASDLSDITVGVLSVHLLANSSIRSGAVVDVDLTSVPNSAK